MQEKKKGKNPNVLTNNSNLIFEQEFYKILF